MPCVPAHTLLHDTRLLLAQPQKSLPVYDPGPGRKNKRMRLDAAAKPKPKSKSKSKANTKAKAGAATDATAATATYTDANVEDSLTKPTATGNADMGAQVDAEVTPAAAKVNVSCCTLRPRTTPSPEENSILGVIYGVLLWTDMNAATPLGVRGRSALCAGSAPATESSSHHKRH